jgi:hypothetical protein
MTTTTNYNIPKPDPADNVDDEFYRLQAAWDMIDLILFLVATEVAGKSNLGHTHPINQVTGLVAALASKMDASKTFTLDDLTDVDGAAAAALNYVLVKTAGGTWQPSSAIAALGPHQHAASDVVGLTTAIANGIAAWVGAAPSALDTLAEFAVAIANDPNFANTITALIATKLALSGGTMTGPIDMGGNPISKVSALNNGPLGALRNRLINGGIDVVSFNQVPTTGLTIAAGATGYVLDRWVVTNTTNQAVVVSQQLNTLGQMAVPGNPKYKLRMAFGTAPTSGKLRIAQRIEGVETLAGFNASARAHFTGPIGAEALSCEVVQNFGTGGAPSASVTTAAASLDIGTVYDAGTQVRKAQFVVPSISGKLLGTGLNDYLELAWLISPRQTGNYEMARASFVEGDASSEIDPFAPRGINLEGMLCKRYYERTMRHSKQYYFPAGYTQYETHVWMVEKRSAAPSISLIYFNTSGGIQGTPSANRLGWAMPITKDAAAGVMSFEVEVSCIAEL